jgi:hypothetical protein
MEVLLAFLPVVMWVMKKGRHGNGEPSEGPHGLFPYVFMLGAAFPTMLVPTLTYNAGNYPAALLAAAGVFIPLGFVVAFLWPVPVWRLGLTGSLPGWLFVLAFRDWAVTETMVHVVGGIPLLALPVVMFVAGTAGAAAGVRTGIQFRRSTGFPRRSPQ